MTSMEAAIREIVTLKAERDRAREIARSLAGILNGTPYRNFHDNTEGLIEEALAWAD